MWIIELFLRCECHDLNANNIEYTHGAHSNGFERANFGRFVEILLKTSLNTAEKSSSNIVFMSSLTIAEENPFSKSHKTIRIERNIRFRGENKLPKRLQRCFCSLPLRVLFFLSSSAHIFVSSFQIKSIHLFLFYSFSSLSAQFHAIMNKSIVKIVCFHMVCCARDERTYYQNKIIWVNAWTACGRCELLLHLTLSN